METSLSSHSSTHTAGGYDSRHTFGSITCRVCRDIAKVKQQAVFACAPHGAWKAAVNGELIRGLQEEAEAICNSP